jgi:hypothetical protein
MDNNDLMQELMSQRFVYSQVIMKMGLALQGKENSDLIKTIHGLGGGLGYSGDVCGVLTGGVCLLSLYAGRGTADEEDLPGLMFMIQNLIRWFDQEYARPHGGNHCLNLVNNQPGVMASLCPGMVAATFQKVKELLVENGFNLSGEE